MTETNVTTTLTEAELRTEAARLRELADAVSRCAERSDDYRALQREMLYAAELRRRAAAMDQAADAALLLKKLKDQ